MRNPVYYTWYNKDFPRNKQNLFLPKDVLLVEMYYGLSLTCIYPKHLEQIKTITKLTHYSQDYLANQYSCSSMCHPRNSQEVRNNDVKESAQRLWLKQTPFLLWQYRDFN